jgi:catechol 2,3-dioxygenase-like lactoylglutathione lyase family enzyme
VPGLSFVTLGARDLDRLRRFYEGWGWTLLPGATDDFACFDAGGVRLALYPLGRLGEEAAPGSDPPPPGWNGVTLAVNLLRRADVGPEAERAVAAGATLVAPPTDRDWGGCSAYVADPEGNRWEIAWAPPGP